MSFDFYNAKICDCTLPLHSRTVFLNYHTGRKINFVSFVCTSALHESLEYFQATVLPTSDLLITDEVTLCQKPQI